LSYDNLLLVEHFRATLKFVAMNWDQPGQPIITFLVRDDMLEGNQQSVILELLHQCNAGECDSILVKTGNLGQLLTTAAVERIDYLHDFEFDDFELNSVLKSHFKTEKTENEGVTGNKNAPLTIKQRQLLASENDKYLSNTLVNSDDPYVKAFAIKLLWQRKGSDYKIPHSSNKETASSLVNIAEKHYEIACSRHQWSIVRELADLTGKFDERLEDALMEIIIRQKRLAVGRAYSEKATFSQPQDSHAIVKRIANYCGKNSAENVLTQEIMMHLGHLIRTKPELFKHMMTLRTWYFVQLLVGQISREQSVSTGEAYELLLNEAPHVIYDKLRSVLGAFSQKVTQLADQENLHVSGITSVDAMKTNALDTAGSDDKDWAQWRLQSGMIGRLPASFYKDVWYLLQQCNGLVIGDKYSIQSRMGSELTLDSTAGERGFALRIDGLLQGIAAPDYRQLNVEVIQRLAKLFRDNPGLHIDDDLVLDVLIGHAVKIAWRKKHATENYDEHRGQAWETFYTLSPQETNWAFIKSLMFLLTT